MLQRVYATHKVLQLGAQIRAIAVVDDVVVCLGNGTALFEVFDLGNVAAVDLFRREGAHFAASKAFLADVAVGHHGKHNQSVAEQFVQNFVFRPAVACPQARPSGTCIPTSCTNRPKQRFRFSAFPVFRPSISLQMHPCRTWHASLLAFCVRWLR